MTGVVLVAGANVPLSPDALYDAFGTSGGGSWLFEAGCSRVAPGEPVALRLPIDGAPSIEVLGRFAKCIPGRRIEILHDLPWEGRLVVRISPDGPSASTVRITADIGPAGIEWIMRHRGWPSVAPPRSDTHRIGVLVSKSGPAAVYSVAMPNLARLAADEINADGGLYAKPIELVFADDATDPARAAVEAQFLVRSGCRAIIAGLTSASFTAVSRTVASSGIPVIHAVMNEGGGGPANVIRWGERPYAQIRAAAAPVMSAAGGRRWFFVGNDYSWSVGAHAAGGAVVGAYGGQVVGGDRVPLGTTSFEQTLDAILLSGADCVLSTLVGSDEAAFEQQSWALGLRERAQTLALVCDDSTYERLSPEARVGVWSAASYFQKLDSAQNVALSARYREWFGRFAPPISGLSEPVYDALHLYAAAVRISPVEDVDAVVRALHRVSSLTARGKVEALGPQGMRQPMRVARAGVDGFEIVC